MLNKMNNHRLTNGPNECSEVIVQYFTHRHTKGWIVAAFIAVRVHVRIGYLTVNGSRIPVNERNDDVLHVDILMELSTGTQERVQGLEVKLIWEHLSKQDTVIS